MTSPQELQMKIFKRIFTDENSLKIALTCRDFLRSLVSPLLEPIQETREFAVAEVMGVLFMILRDDPTMQAISEDRQKFDKFVENMVKDAESNFETLVEV